MNYLILFDAVNSQSFLGEQMNLSQYSLLRIGRETYGGALKANFYPFSHSVILHSKIPLTTYQDFFRFLTEQKVDLANLEDSNVLYWNLIHYPVDRLAVNRIFEAIANTDEAICLAQRSELADTKLELYQLPLKTIVENHSGTLPVVMSSKLRMVDVAHQFIQLDHPSEVLQLFASNFQIRSFNAIASEGYYFVKKSKNKAKIKAEYNFLSNVPAELRFYYPQVGNYLEHDDYSMYQIEKIFNSDVSKYLLCGAFSESFVRKLLNAIHLYLQACPVQKVSGTEYEDSVRKHVLAKTRQRMEQIRQLPIVETLDFVCKSRGHVSINQFAETLYTAIEDDIQKVKSPFLRYSHGDMCFSNMLFSHHHGTLKFIDPKGYNESINECFIPPVYDLAKLSHSMNGLYDLLIYDTFHSVFDASQEVHNEFYFPSEKCNEMSKGFRKFLALQKVSYSQVRLYEASLFLSMLPLHADNAKRQIGQLIQGISAFSAYKNEK